MKKVTNFCIAIASVILYYACSPKPTCDLKKTEWLIGTWESKTHNGNIYETWSKVNNKEYVGKSYMVNEEDTVIFENIRLVQEQDGLFYIPTVNDQNEGLPVRFTSKTNSDSQLVFENRQHDFPQIISYMKISADSLVAEISGIKNGQEHKQVFSMKRSK